MEFALISLAVANTAGVLVLVYLFLSRRPRLTTGKPFDFLPGERYYYGAEILRVIDGDTVEARIDLGFDTHRVETLRLYGINTPELRGESKEKGQAAKAWLESNLDGEITISTIKDETGSFGRYLAVLFCDGENLNEKMLREKIAKPYEP